LTGEKLKFAWGAFRHHGGYSIFTGVGSVPGKGTIGDERIRRAGKDGAGVRADERAAGRENAGGGDGRAAGADRLHEGPVLSQFRRYFQEKRGSDFFRPEEIHRRCGAKSLHETPFKRLILTNANFNK